jgi:protein-disulfide isomerase
MVNRSNPVRLLGMSVVLLGWACIHETGLPDIRTSDAGVIPVASYSPRRGPDSARVTMMEFGDFQCPYCGAAESTVRRVLSSYPNDIALDFVNMPLSFHENALRAAEAFLAAARQGKGWEMHDQMFAYQQALSDTDLDSYAQVIGLDLVQFDADRASPEIADEVAQDEALAAALGVDRTPTFYIDGYFIVGNQPFSVFKKVIDQVLALPVPDAAVNP